MRLSGKEAPFQGQQYRWSVIAGGAIAGTDLPGAALKRPAQKVHCLPLGTLPSPVSEQVPAVTRADAVRSRNTRPRSEICFRADQVRKLRVWVGKLARLGKMVAKSLDGTPNQFAKVAPYWSIAVVGIQRPLEPTSLGPPGANTGIVP
jgi:hypothetical protein